MSLIEVMHFCPTLSSYEHAFHASVNFGLNLSVQYTEHTAQDTVYAHSEAKITIPTWIRHGKHL